MILLKGRRKILTSFKRSDMYDFSKVAMMVNSAMVIHRENKYEIDYLFNYYKGVQPILSKTKTVRDEINNIVVINHAQRITRTIVGYFLGNAIQYIQAGTGDTSDIDKLNRILAYEDKSTVDLELAENQSVCGTAYRIIHTDSVLDDVPFEDKALPCNSTFVVYENNIGEKPVAGVTYHNVLNSKGEIVGFKYYVYTDIGMYVTISNPEGNVDNTSEYEFIPYSVGGIPIVEYPNNPSRIGDWELFTSLMDSINELQSGRLDDIQQIIESLIVFVNADIDTETYDMMREKGVVMLKNMTGAQTSVQVIQNSLDQTGMNIYAKELESLLDTLVGIPSREKRGGGGADTGTAVELRDGWADLEVVARNKEQMFKRSEKMTLKVILDMLKTATGFGLKLIDIDIKFSRNKNHNLLVKTQSYNTLLATKTLTPSDCLVIVDLVSDTNEYSKRGEEYWNAKNEELMAQEIAKTNATKPVEPVNDAV